jgi:5-oxopent-3-ene-1,2,5-tricarboxylate decarboxylase / 2-hydroxyhepta-2,4-diene-1,7-dioate isomerase
MPDGEDFAGMITGTAYGLILNDRQQLDSRAADFSADPYKAPPKAPVLYIKPRTCFTFAGAPVRIPAGLTEVEIAPTIALLIGSDLAGGPRKIVRRAIGAACLALDVSEPHTNYYRPSVRQRSRDGFLPLGAFGNLPASPGDIVTHIDGKEVHRWSLNRLARSIEDLLVDVSAFMTLSAGDLILVGLPGDAPKIGPAKTAVVSSTGLPTLHASFVREDGP